MKYSKKRIYLSIIFLLLMQFKIYDAGANSFYKVQSIYDGDTLTISSGEKVRLLQIDTPELSSKECYAKEARALLIKLIGASQVTLETDKVSANKDKFDRLLRYIFVDKTNLNLKLVEMGVATPYFYKGERGKYSSALFIAAQTAQKNNIGLWKACPNTKLDPYKPVNSGVIR